MKILHTADIHLKTIDDERWQALHTLLSIARNNGVKAFVISGDLFDKDIDAENLRPKIRTLFSNNGFPIIVIPGNHDSQILREMYFGADAVILSDQARPYVVGNVFFWGIPYESLNEQQVLERIQSLKSVMHGNVTNILLFHGELLDIMFNRSDIGDEAGYMPVRLAFFEGVPVRYVLAGHFHTNFDVRTLPNGGYFVYPGSPVAITRREIGVRKINLFDVGNPPADYTVDTPHFERFVVTLDPLDNTNPVTLIQQRLAGAHPNARILLTVDGYFNRDTLRMNEAELARAIDDAVSGQCEEIQYEFRDIQSVLEDDVFSAFMKKLDMRNFDAKKKSILRELAIRAIIGAKK